MLRSSTLKPGGYFELHDIDPGFECDDDSIPENSSALQWSQLFLEACKKIGHAIPSPTEYKAMLEEAGFVDVRLKIMKRPSNVWAKEKHMKRLGLVRFLQGTLERQLMTVHTHEPPQRLARFLHRTVY